MAAVRTAAAHWEGSLFEGSGEVALQSSGLGRYPVSWPARTEEAAGGRTSPEELIAAAHSACYCMQLSNVLAKAGTPPTSLDATAAVTFVPGKGITTSHLTVSAVVPGITADEFQSAAAEAKASCPVSKALAGVEITLEASLRS
jgi:osmotically inducible protein OsmC